MKITIPLGQPHGVYMFNDAYISKGEKSDMYIYNEEVPRKTLKSCINYLKKYHKSSILREIKDGI